MYLSFATPAGVTYLWLTTPAGVTYLWRTTPASTTYLTYNTCWSHIPVTYNTCWSHIPVTYNTCWSHLPVTYNTCQRHVPVNQWSYVVRWRPSWRDAAGPPCQLLCDAHHNSTHDRQVLSPHQNHQHPPDQQDYPSNQTTENTHFNYKILHTVTLCWCCLSTAQLQVTSQWIRYVSLHIYTTNTFHTIQMPLLPTDKTCHHYLWKQFSDDAHHILSIIHAMLRTNRLRFVLDWDELTTSLWHTLRAGFTNTGQIAGLLNSSYF